MRAVSEVHRAESRVERLGTGALDLRLDGKPDLADHGGGLALGIPERLAHVARDRLGDLVLAPGQRLAIGLDDLRALRLRQARPVQEGGACGLYRCAHLGGGSGMPVPDALARGRADAGEGRALAGLPAA